MSPLLVTLLTDFGLEDGYVAAMKGEMLLRAPELRLVDVSHDIAPGDIAAAAYVLLQAAPHFPAGTVHLVVVDPGVGGRRRAIACRSGPHVYVAPDNGVLSRVLDAGPAPLVHAISHPQFARKDASPVFHGRDIFGPVAAYLAAGGALEGVGERLDPGSLVRLPEAEPRREGDAWVSTVIHVDRFGNLITNLRLEPGKAPVGLVEVAGREVPLARTYSDVPDGELVAFRGSSGLLEIAQNGGSAADALGAATGLVVRYRAPQRS